MPLATLVCALLSVLQVPHAIATFDGTFRAVNGKFVEVQVEGGETMRMYTTHSTKFIRAGRQAKPGEFHEGEKVTVDAERDVRMNLLAVRIELSAASKAR